MRRSNEDVMDQVTTFDINRIKTMRAEGRIISSFGSIISYNMKKLATEEWAIKNSWTEPRRVRSLSYDVLSQMRVSQSQIVIPINKNSQKKG